MNSTIGRASSTSRLAFLLGTASAAVLGITSANAQVAIPVTNLGE
ncbi:MAG: hypothetical protein ACKVG0_04910 [Alphaproteobacteria bacterium]